MTKNGKLKVNVLAKRKVKIKEENLFGVFEIGIVEVNFRCKQSETLNSEEIDNLKT